LPCSASPFATGRFDYVVLVTAPGSILNWPQVLVETTQVARKRVIEC
jgi:hypothetical protein